MNNTYLIPKHSKFLLITLIITFLSSCESGTSQQEATSKGFEAIENEIKSKFGDHAFYTDLTIIYNKAIGNSISVTVTENPESLMMGQWNLSQNTWKQASEITIEVPKGTKAADFMFQLDDTISLSKLGALVEQSCEQLKSEKNLEHPTLSTAHIKFPKNGELSKTEYAINLNPENGGTTFSFYYSLAGELIKMDY